MIGFQSGRNLEMVYEENPYGVFIEGTDKILYIPSEWDGSKKANSIVILNETKNLRVYIETYDSWTNDLIYDVTFFHNLLYEVKQCISESQALADLRGEENQYNIEHILSVYESNSDVNIPIGWYNYFIGGGKYLPDGTNTHFASLGELKIIWDNKEGYNSAMAALGEGFQIKENTVLSSSSLKYTNVWCVWVIDSGQIVTKQADSAMGLFVAEY